MSKLRTKQNFPKFKVGDLLYNGREFVMNDEIGFLTLVLSRRNDRNGHFYYNLLCESGQTEGWIDDWANPVFEVFHLAEEEKA